MANCCFTNLVVRGRKECVNKFDEIIHAGYNYDTMEFPDGEHFNRVRDVSHGSYQEYGLMSIQDYLADCAWSAEVCLMNTPGSYYDERVKEEEKSGIKNHSTNIVDVSKQYGLDIELWSQEPAMCFEEHILVKQGEVIENECYEYYEHYIEEFDNYDEFKNTIGKDLPYVTKEMFDDAKRRGMPYIEEEEDFAYTFDITGFETGHGVEMCKIVYNGNNNE